MGRQVSGLKHNDQRILIVGGNRHKMDLLNCVAVVSRIASHGIIELPDRKTLTGNCRSLSGSGLRTVRRQSSIAAYYRLRLVESG
jgi:hypothetical protein